MVAIHKDYLKNNIIAENDTAIVATSYSGHLLFLKYTLQQFMKTGKFVICSYDRRKGETIPNDIMDVPNTWIQKHVTYGAEKRIGWLFDIIYASGIISLYDNFKYILTTNGDITFENPNNFNNLIELLGDNDLMSASSEENGMIHTCCVLWKRETFLNFVNYIKSKLEVNISQSYSPEVLLRDFVKVNKIKNKIVDKQPMFPKGHNYYGHIDHYSSYGQESTFKEIVGYRNLGAEHKQACLEHFPVLDKKYFDMRNEGMFFSKHEIETLYKFYVTGDYRFLYTYFDTGEDSQFNRRYLPLEYYGKNPLMDDSQRYKYGPYSERNGWFNRFNYNSYIIKDDLYFEKWEKYIKEKGYDI